MVIPPFYFKTTVFQEKSFDKHLNIVIQSAIIYNGNLYYKMV